MTEDSLHAWLAEARPGTETEADRPNQVDSTLPDWWDSDGSEDRIRPSRWKLLVVLALLPWLVVFGLWVGRGRATAPTPPPVETAQGQRAAAVSDRPPRAPLPPSPRGVSLDPAFGALAALTVQDVLTGTDGVTGHQRYIDLALPETTIWVEDDVAVVRVAAVVLEGTGGRWSSPRHARYAVPLRAGPEGPEVIGPPWALPDNVDLSTAAAGVAWLQDQGLTEAAQHSLTVAGYADAHVHRLGRDPSIPGVLVAEVTAIAPGEAVARAHAVWLRDGAAPTLIGAGVNR